MGFPRGLSDAQRTPPLVSVTLRLAGCLASFAFYVRTKSVRKKCTLVRCGVVLRVELTFRGSWVRIRVVVTSVGTTGLSREGELAVAR